MSLLKQLITTSPPTGAGIPTDAYRKSHEIDGSTEGAQTDYQVKVEIYKKSGVDSGGNVYVGNKCKADFGDIRFTKADGTTELDYWLKELLRTDGEKIVDGDGSGKSATHAIIRPQAIRHVGAHDRTYIVYCDDGYDPKILYYDHTIDTFSAAVLIALSPIANEHGSPALLIDENGYLHVFYGSHDSNLKHAKSDNPEDISAWTVQADPITNSTYPLPRLASNGDIYLFYRRTVTAEHKAESFVKSTDDGGSWGAVSTPIDFGTGYWIYHSQMVLGSDDRLHIIWLYYSRASLKRENIYYAYSTDGGASWKSKDGTDLGATINKGEADANCLVYDSTGDPAIAYNGWTVTGHAIDLRLDGSNEPYIALTHGKAGNEMQCAFAKWTAGAWNVDNITTTGHPLNWMILDYISSADVRVYAIVGGSPGVDANRGGNLEYWKSEDNGETWNKEETIAYEADMTSLHPKLVENYDNDLRVVWTVGLTLPSDVYAYGEAMVSVAYAVFWVEVDSIPDDPDSATIYIYYGKLSESTTSSILATMIKGDDGVVGNFTEDVAGTAALTHVDGGYKVTENSDDDAFVSGDILPSWERSIHMDSIPFTGPVSEGRGNYKWGLFDDDSIGDMISLDAAFMAKRRILIQRYASNSTTWPNRVIVQYMNGASAIKKWDGDSWEDAITRHEADGTLEFRVWSDGTTIYIDILSGGSSIFAATPSIAIATVKAFSEGRAMIWGEPSTDNYWALAVVDNYFIRKYVDPEPAHGTWGAEEPVMWPF